MKRKLLTVIIFCVALLIFPACGVSADSSIKAITTPYIDEYICTEGKFGDKDLLENYEYIKIILVDKENLEVHYKTKDGEKKTLSGTYSVDEKTREMSADIGLLGFNVKEKVFVKNGEFVIKTSILKIPLYMKFEAD